MDPYEAALTRVIDCMLIAKGCQAKQIVRSTLVQQLRNRLHTIALKTSNGANHAGRATPSYFDVERAFQLLGIRLKDLQSICQASDRPALKFVPLPTPDEDFFKGPQLLLDANLSRSELSSAEPPPPALAHIPDYMPPFPSAHTYKSTVVINEPDKTYGSVRERHAQNELCIKRALNGFYLRTQPTLSLFAKGQKDQRCLLLAMKPPTTKPAYLDALMPRSQVYDIDIYEESTADEPPEPWVSSPFLAHPKLASELRAEREIVEMLDLYPRAEEEEPIDWLQPD